MNTKTLFTFLFIFSITPAFAQYHQVSENANNRPEKSFDISPDSEPSIVEMSVQPQNQATSLPLLNEETLLQQPALLYQAIISSIRLENIEGLKKLIPIYQKLGQHSPHYDEQLLWLAQARIEARAGNNKRAADYYEQILAHYPQMDSIQLDRALNLFHAHYDNEAQQALQDLSENEQLPESTQKGIQTYLNHLNQRQKWQFSAHANFIYDHNINQATEKRIVEINGHYWQTPSAKKSAGLVYRFNASKDKNIFRNYFWNNELDINGRWYWQAHDYDEFTTRVSSGISQKFTQHSSSILPYYERMQYGGKFYSQEWGIRFEHQNWLRPHHRIALAWETGKETFYRKNLHRDGMRNQVSLTWQWLWKPNQRFIFGYDASFKNAPDKSDAYHRHGLRLTWSSKWKNGLEKSLMIAYAHRHYQGADLFQIVRHDKEINAQFNLAHQKIQFYGFQPRLTVQWTQRNSNHPLYTFSKANAFISIGKSF